MKTKIKTIPSQHWVSMFSCYLMVLSLANSTLAKLPELDSVFFGEVVLNDGSGFSPEPGEEIIIIARLNGQIVAESPLVSGSNSYTLKVPIDDGINPRIPNTARLGERVTIAIRSDTLNVEAETVESVFLSGLSLSNEKGSVHLLSLTISDEVAGETTTMANFSSWAMNSGLTTFPAKLIALVDSDGDGQNNLEEFVALTDPLSGTSSFRVLDIWRDGDTNYIEFGPVISGREYTLWCTEVLDRTEWVNIGSVIPSENLDHFLFGHAILEDTDVFYKLETILPQDTGD